MTKEVYSEFGISKANVRFEGDTEQASPFGCTGSIEETANVKVIQKKCEGAIVKEVVHPDGTGEIKLNMHIKYPVYCKAFGMDNEKLKTGVRSYGIGSVHKHFCYTAEVSDEDNEKKLIAYPDCVIVDGSTRKIENGAEEVAEVELTLHYLPDDNGQGKYEALTKDIDENTAAKWLKEFSSDLVKIVSA